MGGSRGPLESSHRLRVYLLPCNGSSRHSGDECEQMKLEQQARRPDTEGEVAAFGRADVHMHYTPAELITSSYPF